MTIVEICAVHFTAEFDCFSFHYSVAPCDIFFGWDGFCGYFGIVLGHPIENTSHQLTESRLSEVRNKHC